MTVETEQIPRTYPEAVRTLAEWHSSLGGPELKVYSFPDPQGRMVRLIEVSPEFPDTGVVLPITLGGSAEFPFASSVVLLTPQRWNALVTGEISPPPGWEMELRKQVWPG